MSFISYYAKRSGRSMLELAGPKDELGFRNFYRHSGHGGQPKLVRLCSKCLKAGYTCPNNDIWSDRYSTNSCIRCPHCFETFDYDDMDIRKEYRRVREVSDA